MEREIIFLGKEIKAAIIFGIIILWERIEVMMWERTSKFWKEFKKEFSFQKVEIVFFLSFFNFFVKLF